MRRRKTLRLKSDEQLAEEIEQHRGDTKGWDQGPDRAIVRKGSTVVFSLRLSAEELETLRDRAAARQMTVSDVIREAVFTNAVSLSIQPANGVITATGVPIDNKPVHNVTSFGSIGSGYVSTTGGGFVSTSGVCSAGPFLQNDTNWNSTIRTTAAYYPSNTAYLSSTGAFNMVATENIGNLTCSYCEFTPNAPYQTVFRFEEDKKNKELL
jgi:hypothetical protein